MSTSTIQSTGTGRPHLAPPAPPTAGHAGPDRPDDPGRRGRPGHLDRDGPVGDAGLGAGRRGQRGAGAAAAATVTPVSQASTSARGVSATSINVVFPVISLSSIAGRLGLAEDKEYGDQTKAIHLFVNQINQAGGIHGRKINPMIVTFDPTDTAGMTRSVQAVDRGQPAGLRRHRRHRDLDGEQPALHHPAGAHPHDRRLDHGHQLDPVGLPLPLVDRGRSTRRCSAPPSTGA